MPGLRKKPDEYILGIYFIMIFQIDTIKYRELLLPGTPLAFVMTSAFPIRGFESRGKW